MLRFVDLEGLVDDEGFYEDALFQDRRKPPKADPEVITPPGPMESEVLLLTRLPGGEQGPSQGPYTPVQKIPGMGWGPDGREPAPDFQRPVRQV